MNKVNIFSERESVFITCSLLPSLESSGNNPVRTSIDASDEASSFIEMDPRMPPSKRFCRNSQDFKFDFPVSPPSLAIVHADQLISNGCLVPFFIDPLKVQTYEDEDEDFNPKSSHTQEHVLPLPLPLPLPSNTSDCSSMRKCRKLSKKVLHKYLSFFKPLYQRIRGYKASSSKSENVARRSKSMKNWEYTYDASPRISVAYTADDWRRSCDSESSIYEAVLHCKKSIGI
ncbi:probable membrane-associated kinase regulator 6 [Cucurbita moschata]|uniref:Probable membrane-associated kinase regulator 6 n=1 Tax=Cucurbita moschata TaxID=3662 RepID=A0A6J1G1V3_CUCMO|nr:probable membrane-associated kinase regulator 6 [Cucurbita moschata]